ncbi:helix-turn-helix domain-containing protein [Cellulomonas phragmiteti]|uniref:Transcriptional regulator n=1 Tax=Cellulomonas phragmiteti TaxID=478780 RepID=A0ABQ4DP56_9CELL|nr:helix-turn-helix transcriptional regulator [Cellulomonas phragmiteti]GIG41114.1 transcriptional regulator [Cellulomonas phragmiteti]
MRRVRTYSRATEHATATLGALIAAARRERRMSVAEVCERVGIDPGTLRSVERGAPTVAIGMVFEVATVLGVPLFSVPAEELPALAARAADRLALLPQRVRATVQVDDDF